MRNEIELAEDSEYSMMGLMFTAGIYCIMTVLALVYLQHRSISKEFESRYLKRSQYDAVSATLGGTVVPPVDIYDPVPALLEGSEEEEYYAEESAEKVQPKIIGSGKSKKKKKHHKPEPEEEKESSSSSSESEAEEQIFKSIE